MRFITRLPERNPDSVCTNFVAFSREWPKERRVEDIEGEAADVLECSVLLPDIYNPLPSVFECGLSIRQERAGPVILLYYLKSSHIR